MRILRKIWLYQRVLRVRWGSAWMLLSVSVSSVLEPWTRNETIYMFSHLGISGFCSLDYQDIFADEGRHGIEAALMIKLVMKSMDYGRSRGIAAMRMWCGLGNRCRREAEPFRACKYAGESRGRCSSAPLSAISVGCVSLPKLRIGH